MTTEQLVRGRRRRNRSDADQAPREAQSPVPIMPTLDIRPDGVYLPAQVKAALGLRVSSLRSEWRQGRLRIIRRCGRNYLLGRDVLNWLNGGELPSPASRRRSSTTDNN